MYQNKNYYAVLVALTHYLLPWSFTQYPNLKNNDHKHKTIAKSIIFGTATFLAKYPLRVPFFNSRSLTLKFSSSKNDLTIGTCHQSWGLKVFLMGWSWQPSSCLAGIHMKCACISTDKCLDIQVSCCLRRILPVKAMVSRRKRSSQAFMPEWEKTMMC